MIKNLNFILILTTIVVLSAIGIIFIFGSGYSWVQSIKVSDWRQTPLYQNYVSDMNLAVLPLSVILVAVMGLCIPKRLFSGKALLRAMGFLLAATLATAALLGPKLGMGVLLVAATLIQVVVIGMTLAGDRRLSYETQGFFVQIGSAVLHLGFIIFLVDFILLSGSPAHLDVFWLSTILIGVGMVLCFYSAELARLRDSGPPPLADENK
ncbi:MAG: hypothetical protein Q8L35_03865 [Actinomycetota bacterium]|nr:hypothetical protein [Actinomycetota bacterium]